MESLRLLMTVFPLALTSGINLYATVCVVGLSIRFGWATETPAALDTLASWPVIVVAGVLYVIEFIVDKFDFLDNVWDVAHTFIRPVGAVWMSLHLLGPAYPTLQVIGCLLAGTTALGAHASKAGARIPISMTGEPASTVGVSLAEDAFAVGLALLAIRYPYAAAAVALIAIILIAIYLPRLVRWALFMPAACFARVRSWFPAPPRDDRVPSDHMPLLGHDVPEMASRCKTRRVPGVSGRTGFLSIGGDTVSFTYRKRFGVRKWTMPLSEIEGAYVRRGWLADRLDLHFHGAKGRARSVLFIFTKDRRTQFQAFANYLHAQETLPRRAQSRAKAASEAP